LSYHLSGVCDPPSKARKSIAECVERDRRDASMSVDAGGAELSHPIVPVLVGVLLVVGGGYLYYSGMQASANAEPVDATVVSSHVVDNRNAGSDTGKDYTVAVEYRYAYEGETYTSENLCPGVGSSCAPSSDFRTDMQDAVNDYPEGGTVTAYVPPSNPSGAYLIRTGPSLIYLGVAGVGGLLVVLGVRRILTE
jgi:hypothetical protein